MDACRTNHDPRNRALRIALSAVAAVCLLPGVGPAAEPLRSVTAEPELSSPRPEGDRAEGSPMVGDPADGVRLPEWIVASDLPPAGAIADAFDLSNSAPLPGPPAVRRGAGDLGDLLGDPAAVAEPGASADAMRQLERAAGEAKTPHALTRLIERCRRTAITAPPEEGQRVRRLNAWAHHARGRLRAAAGEPRLAGDDFAAAVLLDGENLPARADWAVSLAEAGHDDRAMQEFDQILAAAPGDAAARHNRAELRFRQGEIESTIVDCNAAVASLLGRSQRDEPRLAAVYGLRGRALQAAGRRREAGRDLNESLRLRPDDPATLINRGNVFAESGYYDQAVADYLAALAADPRSAVAYRSLAWVLATCPDRRLRDAATAIEAASRARMLSPGDDVLTLDATAAAHAAAGDFATAIRWQQRAVMAAGDTPPPGLSERLARYERGLPHTAPGAPPRGARVQQAAHDTAERRPRERSILRSVRR